MTVRTRRNLFYLGTLIFCTLGTWTVFYAQGWRFDTNTLEFTKVGGIYIKSSPVQATISLDEEPIENKAGIFNNGTLINNLLPRTYKLNLHLPNYKPWQRHIAVKPSLVTEIKTAILVPFGQEISTTNSQNINDFWLVGEKTIARNSSNTLFLDGTEIPGNELVGFTTNNASLLLRQNSSSLYYWYHIEQSTSTNLTTQVTKLQKNISQTWTPIIHKGDNSKIILLSDKGIFLVAPESNTLERIGTSTTQQVELVDSATNRIAWATKPTLKSSSSQISIYDESLRKTKSYPSPLLNIRQIEWLDENNLLLHDQEKGIHIFNAPQGTTEEIISGANTYSLNRQKNKIAATNQRGIEIVSIRDKNDYRRFNLETALDVEKIIWHQAENHIFLVYPDKASFFDLDDLLTENIIEVSKSEKFTYNPSRNEAYSLAEGSMHLFKFP